MSDKTQLWDKLGKTDPKHTKTFKRAGGFSGTAIKPMWAYRRMTEEFGSCGAGWGVGEPSFQVVNGPEGEVLVYCTASIWYQGIDDRHTVYGVGGDKAVGKNKYGLAADDEAFKKAYTDAVTNALKMIGVGADVHMGLFDDNKYVNDMRAQFEGQQQAANDAPAKSSASLKRDGQWEEVTEELNKDLLDVKTERHLEDLMTDYRSRVKEKGWPKAWQFQLSEIFETKRAELQAEYLRAG